MALRRAAKTSLAAITIAVGCALTLPAASHAARQVLVLGAHVENFLGSYTAVRTTLRSRGYFVDATDVRGRLAELEAPIADLNTLTMLDTVARENGFMDYSDWLQVARSVLVAERFVSDPPERGELEAALAELKGDPFLSENQKVRLIASLRRSERVTAVMRPLGPNVSVVRPFVDRIRETVGLGR